jgi:Zn-dependent M28 family amino/carboxypeptidase
LEEPIFKWNDQVFQNKRDFLTINFSGKCNFEKKLDKNIENFGCNLIDFKNFQPNNIALISRLKTFFIVRGICTYTQKVENAKKSGALAVIIYNTENDLFESTVHHSNEIPVIHIKNKLGIELINYPNDIQIYLKINPIIVEKNTSNLIIESIQGDEDNIIVAGAHLDSVSINSGINDNASGSSMLIEISNQLTKIVPINKIIFCWWYLKYNKKGW